MRPCQSVSHGGESRRRLSACFDPPCFDMPGRWSAPLAAAEPQTPCNLRTLSIELTTCIARGRKRNIKRELVPDWGFPYLSCEGVVTLAAEVRAKRPRSADLAGKLALSWRRFAKFHLARV